MASFYGVVLGSFVALVRGTRFSNFGVSRARQGESVVVGRRPDNVYDDFEYSSTPCLRHTDVVFIGQLKLVNNSFFQPCAFFYKYAYIVDSSYLVDHGWQLRNSPLRLDCCTQCLILFARLNTKARQWYTARQLYATSSVHYKAKGRHDVTFNL